MNELVAFYIGGLMALSGLRIVVASSLRRVGVDVPEGGMATAIPVVLLLVWPLGLFLMMVLTLQANREFARELKERKNDVDE